MSDKDTTQKPMTKYDKKIQKRKEEELKELKKKKIFKIAGLAIAIICVAGIVSIPVTKYIATNSTFVTIGGDAVTQVEFDYYYHSSVNDYVNQYGSFLSYMGLDTTKDFASQAYSDTMSWEDYFEQTAANTIIKTKALTSEAKANGFTYDASKEIDKHMENMKNAADEAGLTLKTYYKATYGSHATADNVKKYLSDALYASAYYSKVADESGSSDEEITAHYNENKADYDSVDYRFIEVAADIPTKEATADAPAVEPTQAEIDSAMAAAKAEATSKLKVVTTDGELKEKLTKESINSKFNEWLFDAARKAGDTIMVEDTDSNKYYVLAFEKRYLDETPTTSIRTIMTEQDNGEAIVQEWKDTGATEDAFLALVEKYSEDDYTNMSGGLYEGLTETGLTEELSTWIFDAARKTGDVTSLVMADGYTYVMYYVGEGNPAWKNSIANTLLTETMGKYLTEIMAPFEVSDTKGNLKYLTAETTPATDNATETSTEKPTETPTESTAEANK